MVLTREEILDALERHAHRRERARLRQHRELIDDATDLHLHLGLSSFLFVDMATWLGQRIGRRLTAEDLTMEDLSSVGGMLRLAARFQPDSGDRSS